MGRVLLSVLDEYVRTGLPVGSRTAARAVAPRVSSATVRSAMAELMALGLLRQPHTSAGRTPTDSAFRLWVDWLLSRSEEGAADPLEEGLALEATSVEAAGDMHGAADLLSRVSGQLGFFVGPEPRSVRLSRVSFARISSERVMAILVSSNAAVHTRLIEDGEFDARALEQVGSRLSEFVAGQTLDQARRRLADEIHRERARSDRLWRALTRLGTASLEATETELYVSDPTLLLRQPEFGDVDEVLGLLSALEEKERMLRLLNKIVRSDSLQVVIGDELDDPDVRKCAVVTAQLGDAPSVGGLGVIGPVRMRYDRIIPLVRYVSERTGLGSA